MSETIYLTPVEVAQILRCAPQTLARKRCEGGFIPFTHIGRRVVYRKADVDAYRATIDANLKMSTSGGS